jgi:hypothetical protein
LFRRFSRLDTATREGPIRVVLVLVIDHQYRFVSEYSRTGAGSHSVLYPIAEVRQGRGQPTFA